MERTKNAYSRIFHIVKPKYTTALFMQELENLNALLKLIGHSERLFAERRYQQTRLYLLSKVDTFENPGSNYLFRHTSAQCRIVAHEYVIIQLIKYMQGLNHGTERTE